MRLEARTLISGEEASVASQIDLGAVLLTFDEEPDETWIVQDPFDGEPLGSKGPFRCRRKTVHRIGFEAEEVQVSCTPVDGARHDEGRPAGQCEVLRVP